MEAVIIFFGVICLVSISWFLNLLNSTPDQRANMGRFDKLIGVLVLIFLGYGAWALSEAGDDLLSLLLIAGFGVTLSQLI